MKAIRMQLTLLVNDDIPLEFPAEQLELNNDLHLALHRRGSPCTASVADVRCIATDLPAYPQERVTKLLHEDKWEEYCKADTTWWKMIMAVLKQEER